MSEIKNFVIDINANDYERSRASACIYCGNTTGIQRDHVISVAWTGFRRSYQSGDIVKACQECNRLLSDKPFFSISSRSNFLSHALTKKYSKILKFPDWEENEFIQMSIAFQKTIRANLNLKKFIEARIVHCVMVSLEDSTFQSVKQVTISDTKLYRILLALYQGESFEDISKEFGMEISELKLIFKRKKSHRLVTTFKFEHNIPLEAPIYPIFTAIRKIRQKDTS